MSSRRVTTGEITEVIRTITTAFGDDPVWGPALRPSTGAAVDLEPYWRLFVESAMDLGTARTTDDGAAVSIWLPPGTAELDERRLSLLDAFIAQSFDAPAIAALHALYDRFDASRADQVEHVYLSLLATHPAHRAQGRGQMLLAEDLAMWDAAGVPQYLESTNAGNNHRYARAGFRPTGGFSATLDDTWITAMWRSVGRAAGA